MDGLKATFSVVSYCGQLREGVVVSPLSNLTVCIDIYPTHRLGKWAAFTYQRAAAGERQELGIGGHSGHLRVWLAGTVTDVPRPLPLRAWHTVCVSWSSATAQLVVYINGSLSHESQKAAAALPGGGSLTLGQFQLSAPNASLPQFDPSWGFLGHLYYFRLWDRVRGGPELAAAPCARGSLLHWSHTHLRFTGNTLRADPSLRCALPSSTSNPASPTDLFTTPTSSDRTTSSTLSSERTTSSPSSERTTSSPSSERTTSSPSSFDRTTSSPSSSDRTTSSPTSSDRTTSSPTSSDRTTSSPTSSDRTTSSPSSSDRTTSSPSSSDRTTSSPSSSDRTTSSPASSDRTTSSPSSSDRTTSSPSSSDRTTSSPTSSDRTTSSPTSSDRTTSSPTSSDRTTSSPTSSDRTTSSPTSFDRTTSSPSSFDRTTSSTFSSDQTISSTLSSDRTTSSTGSSDWTTSSSMISKTVTTASLPSVNFFKTSMTSVVNASAGLPTLTDVQNMTNSWLRSIFNTDIVLLDVKVLRIKQRYQCEFRLQATSSKPESQIRTEIEVQLRNKCDLETGSLAAVPGTILVQHLVPGKCQRDLWTTAERIYIWPSTSPLKTAQLSCKTHPSALSYRECELSAVTDRAVWLDPNMTECRNIPNSILELESVQVTAANVEEVAGHVLRLTGEVTSLSTHDLEIVVSKTSDIVWAAVMDVTLASNVLGIINNLLVKTYTLGHLSSRNLRQDHPSKILVNLCTSLFMLNMAFLSNSWMSSFHQRVLCVSAAAVLHYLVLTSCTWMCVEAVHMYLALVRVFNIYIRHYILKLCLIGWGLPATIVITLLSVDAGFYGDQEMRLVGPLDTFCWLQSGPAFYTSVVTYCGLVFLVNLTVSVVVLRQITVMHATRRGSSSQDRLRHHLRATAGLTVLLGLSWGFAFFAWGPAHLPFTYLFSVLNTLQGLFIFVFHCLMKDNVRTQWRLHLCCGRLKLDQYSEWSRAVQGTTVRDWRADSWTHSKSHSSTTSCRSSRKNLILPQDFETGFEYSDQCNTWSDQYNQCNVWSDQCNQYNQCNAWSDQYNQYTSYSDQCNQCTSYSDQWRWSVGLDVSRGWRGEGGADLPTCFPPEPSNCRGQVRGGARGLMGGMCFPCGNPAQSFLRHPLPSASAAGTLNPRHSSDITHLPLERHQL
ncbi:adhesion G-protein coupled receptor G4 [Pristis pectinata]|uniref:adhesion G-protein coupled receptor G4 n=1 Tax=Pristis pectinata TaxID=685728 RepID=UPI00223D11C4|nr:adhesion G-protein coupled receptor G4 [Pristis pectinata]